MDGGDSGGGEVLLELLFNTISLEVDDDGPRRKTSAQQKQQQQYRSPWTSMGDGKSRVIWISEEARRRRTS